MKHPIIFKKQKEPVIGHYTKKNKFLCPSILKFKKNLYRLYFSEDKKNFNKKNRTVIRSAVSRDLSTWSVEKGKRINFLNDSRYQRILSPNVIKISKSLFRMYFEARTYSNKGVIKSAISKDGFKWKEEFGIRIGSNNNYSYGTPFCLFKSKNNFELFFELRKKKTRDIWSIKSNDGLNFNKKKSIRTIKQDYDWEAYSVNSPNIIYFKKLYHMYYAGYGGEPLRGQILYAYSKDKKNWKKSKIPVLNPGGKYDHKHCAEPTLIKINKKLKIFYEACDKYDFWRILCAE